MLDQHTEIRSSDTDTICAIATSQGRSGVGIVRISGARSLSIASTLLGFTPAPRHAYYSNFCDPAGEIVDQGIALYFQAPHSFTGEDVVELQGHGGVYVLNALRDLVLSHGARIARPGEFSERAFLNNKIDLIQAEAIADLIDANSQQAARSAMRTLQGDFSRQIRSLLERLIAIRVNVEAAIDFSDEDIDVLTDTRVAEELSDALITLESIYRHAKQGALLQEGINVVIAGKPNAGKSSLLNALSGIDSAIVTDIPGTTRDLLREHITIDGIPLHIVDTAGLRESDDVVEQEGVRRARAAIEGADRVLLVIDATERDKTVENLLAPLIVLGDKKVDPVALLPRTTLVINKCDLTDSPPDRPEILVYDKYQLPVINLSAKTGWGVDKLTRHLLDCIGFDASEEGTFTARQRHLDALAKCEILLNKARLGVSDNLQLELVAEDLRLAQQALGEITGEFSSDDLLGQIFSSFCVGK